MPQLFHHSTNAFSRLSIFGSAFVLLGIVAFLGLIARSPLETGVNRPVEQPIAFSHRLHVGEEGLDCRYCHTTVEQSAFAGMPASEVCMNCHRQVQAQSPLLELLRRSIANDVPIAWNRVYDLPDFAYFDHSIHVTSGFGCETCHGRVDTMPTLWKAASLQMTWCLDCHRDPAQHVRPREAVFVMGYQPGESQATLGPRLVAEFDLESKVSCSACHR